MKELSKRVAVVTGAASGIGFAMCERFAQDQMSVVMADIEEGPLAVAADKIRSMGGEVLAKRIDVAKV